MTSLRWVTSQGFPSHSPPRHILSSLQYTDEECSAFIASYLEGLESGDQLGVEGGGGGGEQEHQG